MKKKLHWLTRWFYLALLVGHMYGTVALAQTEQNGVLVVDVEGPVTPVMLSFIERSIEAADLRNAEALIIRLDTPGGQVGLTQEIIQTIISADVPVVVYVWPPGGFAASAGTFITLAGHAAAMAPNTSIGAASPIDMSGGDINDTLRAKVENMLVAEIKGLTERRSEEAIEWAEAAITEAKAANANEALEIGVVDFVANDLDDLLEQLDGFTVNLQGEERVLATKEVSVDFLETTLLEEILGFLTNPNVALWLVSIGALALMYEVINPGTYIGGIFGLIFILLGAYGIGQLPVNYAGVTLLILAFVLLVAELFTPTFGVLTGGGLLAFVVGALILFNTAEFAYRIPIPSIMGMALFLALVFGFGLRKMLQSMRLQPVTGSEGLVGAVGTVKVALQPSGTILVWGERWQATSRDRQPIETGEEVEVTDVEGFQLKVKRKT